MKGIEREIRLSSVSPNLRTVCESESIRELSASISARGLTEPIQVWFCGESFRIVDGEKRWRACKSLGLTHIRAVIEEVVSEEW